MFSLPRVSIPRWARAARNLQSTIRLRFGFEVVVVDILDVGPAREYVAIAVALDEKCSERHSCMNHWLPLAHANQADLSRSERCYVRQLVESGTTSRGPFSSINWFDSVVDWVSGETNLERPELMRSFEQYNASPISALIHFNASANDGYWFKSSKESDSEEFRITSALSGLLPEHLPRVVAWHEGWSAWLAEDGGKSVETKNSICRKCSEGIMGSLASLHMKSAPYAAELLQSGCADQRLSIISAGMTGLIPYLEAALEPCERIDQAHVDKARLHSIITLVQDACFALDSLGLPNTIAHNHLNLGNILMGKRGWVFTDWADAGVGNPLANFGQLCPQLAAFKTTGLRRPQLAKIYTAAGREIIPSPFLACAS